MERNKGRSLKNRKDKFKILGMYIIVVLFIFVLFIIVTGREVMLKVDQPVLSSEYIKDLDNTDKLVGNMLKTQHNATGYNEIENKEVSDHKEKYKEVGNVEMENKETLHNEVHNAANIDETKDTMNDTTEIVNVNITDIIWPLKGVIVQNVGLSYSKTFGDYRYHDGIDIKAERGAEVVATLSGEVIDRETTQSEGIKITIDHGQGWVSIYKHLGDSDLKLEEKIKIGEKVGIIKQPSNNEDMEGNHLHYCLLKDNIVQNPLEYLSK